MDDNQRMQFTFDNGLEFEVMQSKHDRDTMLKHLHGWSGRIDESFHDLFLRVFTQGKIISDQCRTTQDGKNFFMYFVLSNGFHFKIRISEEIFSWLYNKALVNCDIFLTFQQLVSSGKTVDALEEHLKKKVGIWKGVQID